MNSTQGNFKSFDNTKHPQRTNLIEHNRTNSIYHQGSYGVTQGTFLNDRTRNGKIAAGNSMVRMNGTQNKLNKLNGSFMGNANVTGMKNDLFMGS